MYNIKKNIITNLNVKGIFTWTDIHFAQFLAGFAAAKNLDIFLAAALVSRATRAGDICLDLNDYSDRVLLEGPNGHPDLRCPSIERWLERLSASPVIGTPGQKRPLILDERHRIYLYRYWEYENILASLIKKRIQVETDTIDPLRLKKSLDRHFPEHPDAVVDWQKIAAATAVIKKICILTGGPGTGKTFVIAKILALFLELAPVAAAVPRICLAAPTGKAAARLQESIRQAIPFLNCSEAIKRAIPVDVKTIHRMLKPQPNSPYFYYNAENQLPADMVIIDEASMVDLALMSKLAQASPMNARLVLIGDKDQLASVEAGSVLGDICDRSNLHGFSDEFRSTLSLLTGENINAHIEQAIPKPGLQDAIVELRESRRFTADSGIGALSKAIKRGDVDDAFKLFSDASVDGVGWHAVEDQKDFFDLLTQTILDGYQGYLHAADPLAALDGFNRFKILCALRMGPFGVTAINALAEKIFERCGLIDRHSSHSAAWYKGRPILITSNDYDLELFNGDIGIAMPDAHAPNDALWVFFPAGSGGVKRVAVQHLPAHETVFAMTVHKSQGSEFDEILLILPPRDNPLLSRELVYTGLTRAKKKFWVWAPRSILKRAIKRKIDRRSGLREALWK